MGKDLLKVEEWLLKDEQVVCNGFDRGFLPQVQEGCEFRLREVLEMGMEATKW